MKTQQIYQEKPWIIAQMFHNGVEIWTISKDIGRFTFYIQGSFEKIFFVYTIEKLKKRMQEKPDQTFFFAYDHQVGFWLKEEDVDIFLKYIKLTEEEQKTKEILIQSEAKTSYSYH